MSEKTQKKTTNLKGFFNASLQRQQQAHLRQQSFWGSIVKKERSIW
jgi:hypothetical protein